MSRPKTIVRNIASNWVGFAVNAAVTMLLTPYVLRNIGDARYGVWMLVFSVVGYYGLLDLGFRGGVNQYLTRHLAVGNYEKVNHCASSSFFALSGLGIIISVISVGAAFLAPRLLHFPPDLVHEAFWSILLVGCASGIQCAFFPFSAVFTATQRYDLANAIGIFSRLVTAVGIFFAVRSGYALVGLSAVTCAVTLLDYMIRWRVAYRLIPELQVSASLVNRHSIREISSFGLWNFLISVSSYLAMNAHSFLIGVFMPVAAIAQFALATNLSRQLTELLTPVGQVFYPVAAQHHARGEISELNEMYINGSRLMLTLTICAVILSGFWAHDFYRLWIGEKYVNPGIYPPVDNLFRLLLISVVVTYANSIGGQILLGANAVDKLAKIAITEAVFNVLLAAMLIKPFGLYGVAAAAVVSAVAVRMIAIPILIHRDLHLDVRRYIIDAWDRPLRIAVMLVGFTFLIHKVLPATTWPRLLGLGLLSGCAALGLIVWLGLSRQERRRFVVDPLRRLRGVPETVTT